MSNTLSRQKLINQKEVLSSLETETSNIETSDLLTENRILKTEIAKYQAFLEKEKKIKINLDFMLIKQGKVLTY